MKFEEIEKLQNEKIETIAVTECQSLQRVESEQVDKQVAAGVAVGLICFAFILQVFNRRFS